MNSAELHPQKEARRRASLERKLMFQELGRRFWLLVGVDFLVAALFFIGTLVHYEQTAGSISESMISETPVGAGYTISTGNGYQAGYSFEPWLSQITRNHGFVRNLWMEENDRSHLPEALAKHLRYSISIPENSFELLSPDKAYRVVIFSFAQPLTIFFNAFGVLLVLEGFGLLGDIFKIRSSIRNSLMPIYELTLAAQNMSKGANPVMVLPEARELQLSGTIDTLNTITENDLDRRIVITDEREELRGLAEAINAMLDRLDAAYRSQLRFVSDASHELRTPIAVIQGYTNMLDRWGKNDQATLQESIDAIKSEASSMKDLIEQLLFLARSDNRSIVLNVVNVDTCALADEVLRETQMIDPSHEFASRLTGGLTVRGDIQLLKQALRIFVDNAIKYTPNGGKITISTLEDNGYAMLSVTDNGIGIPAEDLSHVFDRFFRSDESRTRGTGGTGLGLSIAKWIIDRHGGFVEIVSRVDFGTKITVGLPKFIEKI